LATEVLSPDKLTVRLVPLPLASEIVPLALCVIANGPLAPAFNVTDEPSTGPSRVILPVVAVSTLALEPTNSPVLVTVMLPALVVRVPLAPVEVMALLIVMSPC